MSYDAVCQSLSRVLADTYVLMLKTQNVHWNVTGPEFLPVHQLSEEQYGELFAAVDELAERIRALGGKAPGTMREYLELTRLKEGAGGASASAMVRELGSVNRKMAELLREEIDLVDDLDEDGTEDTFVARLKVHEKVAWMWEAMGAGASTAASAGSSNGSAKREVVAAAKPSTEKPVVKAEPKGDVKPAAKQDVKSEAKVEAKPKKDKPVKGEKKKGRLSRSISGTG